jgi:hypothetical protein
MTLAALCVGLLAVGCSNSAEPPRGIAYEVPHRFIGKHGKAARDLSGIACAPGQGVRRCLVVDDESDSPQWATLDGTSFVAGDPVPLVGERDGAGAFGAQPELPAW